jgi:hypothetical protein
VLEKHPIHAFIIAILMILLIPAYTLATHNSYDTVQNRQDTTYIKHYSDKLIVKIDVDNDIDWYLLEGSNFKYDIRPNFGTAKTISFNYRWAYFEIGYLPRMFNSTSLEKKRGDTNGFGYGTGITTPHIVGNISYRKVSGFYLHNTEDYIDNWNPDIDDYIQFPELNVWTIRGKTSYKFNPNYSIRAIQYQTEAQRKSAASFVTGISYDYYVIDNSNPTAASSQKSNNLQLLAHVNYYGTLVLHKRLYVAGGAGIAAGGSNTWLTTRFQTGERFHSTYSSFVTRGIVHTGIGYNAEHFISGAEMLYAKSFSNQQKGSVEMQFTRITFQVFIGYRFNAPKFLNRALNTVERVL